MKQFQRLISAVLVFCMFVLLLPAFPMPAEAVTTLSLAELQAKYPNGKYWNHADKPGSGASVNNPGGWTNIPCNHDTSKIGTASQTCNGFTAGGSGQLSWQCMGFAEQLGYLATGYNPRNNANGWHTYYDSSAMNNLKAGDIVRYSTGSGAHSIYITAVNGDNVTYAECNNGHTCKIGWGRTTKKSTLTTKVLYVRSAPGSISGDPITFNDVWSKDITSNSAYVQADVTWDGTTLTQVGLKWGFSTQMVNTKLTDTVGSVLTKIYYQFGEGEEGPALLSGTTYYYQFYAVDGNGKEYVSKQKSFTTTGNPQKSTFSFNANGGSGTMSAMTVAVGGTITAPTNTFTRSGYDFAGWNVKRGDGKWFVAGKGWFTDSEIVSKGYTKRVYEDGFARSYDQSWFQDLKNNFQNYTFYALWKESENELASGICGDDLTWVLSKDGTLTISGTGDMYDFEFDSDIVVEDGSISIEGGISLFPDTPWSEYADSILSVVIEEGATSIGNNAFYYCDSLTGITIPESVTSIGTQAFEWCASLPTISIPAGVTSIGDCALTNCESLTCIDVAAENEYYSSIDGVLFNKDQTELLTLLGAMDGSYVIPDSVTAIGNGAFSGCKKLTEITFVGDAPTFGEEVFRNVAATVYYPANNETWTADVMQQYGGTITWVSYIPGLVANGICGDDLTWVLTEDGKLTISGTGDMYDYTSTTMPWIDYIDSIKTVVIEEGATSIGEYAFYNHKKLASVTIPDGVTTIDRQAFMRAGIVSITIPGSVTSISNGALSACQSLTTINVAEENEYYVSVDNVLFNKDQTELHTFPAGSAQESYSIPDGVTGIGSYAFAYNENLTGVEIPDSVTTISHGAFEGCSSLAEIEIPDGVTSIEMFTFSRCTSLTSLTIPENVTQIGIYAFYYCTGLTEMKFTGNAPSFGTGENVFGLVTADVYYREDNETWSYDVMQQYGGTITWVPYTPALVANGICGDDLTWVLTEDGKLTISGTGDMYDFTSTTMPWIDYIDSIKTVVIEEGATSIGEYAFYNHKKLASVTIPDGVTTIDRQAFMRAGIVSITIPGSVTSISNGALSACQSLTTINVAEENEYYVSVDNVLFNKDQTELHTFPAGSAQESYSIPDGVTGIGSYAFAYNENLNGIEIPDSVTTISHGAFEGCSSLAEIEIPDGVTSIEMFTFSRCSSLTSLTIPENVTQIGIYAFYYCTGLTEMKFTGNAPSFGAGDYIFGNVTATAFYPAGDATWTEEVMKQYDGIISWVAYETEPEVELFTIPSTNMTLGNSLAMNFWVNEADIVGEDYYAQIVKTYADGREDAKVQIPFSEWKYNSGYKMYYFTFDGIAAKEMGDELYVTVYTTDGTQVSQTKTDSIRDYVVRNIGKWTGETRTMGVDMLNYGAAAQSYFEYDAENPANAGMDDYQQYATQSVAMTDNRVKGTNYVGSTLKLESSIVLGLYFQNLTRDMNAVVTFTDHYGNEKTMNIPGSEFDTLGDYLGVEVDELVIADGSQLVTCVIFDANGNEVARAVDSVESYISRMSNLDALFEQIMKFSASSYAYFH